MIGCQGKKKKILGDNIQVLPKQKDYQIQEELLQLILEQAEMSERQVNGAEGHRSRVD